MLEVTVAETPLSYPPALARVSCSGPWGQVVLAVAVKIERRISGICIRQVSAPWLGWVPVAKGIVIRAWTGQLGLAKG